MEISTIGIDLSKTTFHLIGLSPRGEIVLRKIPQGTCEVMYFAPPWRREIPKV
jgi:hypothetical protein